MSHTETFFKPNIFETDTETFFETNTDTLKKMGKVSIPRLLETRCHTLIAPELNSAPPEHHLGTMWTTLKALTQHISWQHPNAGHHLTPPEHQHEYNLENNLVSDHLSTNWIPYLSTSSM